MSAPQVLQLRRCASAQRETVGWFLAGDDPVGWLDELGRWKVPLEELSCYLIPRGTGEFGAGGLLVIPPAGAAKPADARALVLGMIGGKLLLPVDAEIFPPATAAEVGALCRAAVTLFHPAIGLVAFEAPDARGVWNFLAPPVMIEANWNLAQAGATLDSRLAGVVLPMLPGMEDIFGEASKEIGSEPLGELPPRPREPSAGAGSRLGRQLQKWGAAAAAKLFSFVPSNRPRRTWINDVLDWANAKLGSVSQEMEELRQRELLRLMHLLESDPERGLRHALPLGGPPGRGQQTPGAQLGTRVVDFNLRNIGGGKPVDPWNVPWEMRKKLIARYRELALHEQQLGRFKRAAYIHAELLGDLSAAAAVLKEGRLFAEAAVLYRDHLRQPLAAAECFVEGGLFAEAIAIYEKENKWLELGDLHRRLGNDEAAEVAFRRVVERMVTAGEFVEAAELLEERLRSPDEALALLRHGWPGTPQAAQCLAAEFALLGRLGRHPAALERLAALRAEQTPPPKIIVLGEILSGLGGTYPDTVVRETARDLTRVKVSTRLDRGEQLPEVRAAVQIIARLAPADRLLARDASRFLAARTELLSARQPSGPPPLPRKPGSGRIGAPQPVGMVRLPPGLTWMAVRRLGHGFLAATQRKGRAVFVRGNWRGNIDQIETDGRWKVQFPVAVLAADESLSQPDFVLTEVVLLVGRFLQVFPPTDSFPKSLRLGMPAWIPESAIAMSVSGAQWWVARFVEGELILEERSAEGRLIGSFNLPELIDAIARPVAGVQLLALRLHVWLAFGANLVLFKGGRVERRWQLESEILGLEASAPFLPGAIVARCERGVAVFWHDALTEEVEMIASEIPRPRAAFLGNGALILLAGETDGRGCDGLAIDLDRNGIHSEQKFHRIGGPPIGLISTDRPDDFAIFDNTGAAQIMRLPAGG